MFKGDHRQMNGVKYFGVDDSEKLMVSKKRNPSNYHKKSMVHIHIFPFPNIVVSFKSSKVHFKVYNVADKRIDNRNNKKNFRKGIVYVWFQELIKQLLQEVDPDY